MSVFPDYAADGTWTVKVVPLGRENVWNVIALPGERDFNFGLMLEKSISFWISSSS